MDHPLSRTTASQELFVVLRDQILSVRGVTGIPAFALTMDRAQRTMRADFTITTARGQASGGVRIA